MRGVAGVAAVFALPLLWLWTPSAHSHPVTQPPVPRTIAGSWSILFGQFDFVRTGSPGTFSDRVVDQRLGVFCPKANDQNGQLVLHRHKRNWRVYTGTWEWFHPATCTPAGYGRVSVVLWRYKPYAFFTAYPPPGARGSADEFRIERTS